MSVCELVENFELALWVKLNEIAGRIGKKLAAELEAVIRRKIPEVIKERMDSECGSFKEACDCNYVVDAAFSITKFWKEISAPELLALADFMAERSNLVTPEERLDNLVQLTYKIDGYPSTEAVLAFLRELREKSSALLAT